MLVHSQVEPVRGDAHTPGCQPRPTLPSSPSEGPIPCPPPGPCSLPAGPGPPVSYGHLPHQLPGSPAWPPHRPCRPMPPHIQSIPAPAHTRAARGCIVWVSGLVLAETLCPVPGELPPGARGPTSSHCWLGQTQCPAKAMTPNWPPQGPLVQAKPRRGYQWRPACAVALCAHLEGRGGPGALGRPPALCPRRQRPAARLHLREGQSGP